MISIIRPVVYKIYFAGIVKVAPHIHIGLKLGERAPDVLRKVWYRPDFFGRHYGRYLNAVMRGPSEWSVGERELFAAFVSRLNQCAF